jgi:tripartite-type tricarboxylate transporter receptor subunit TctC
MPAIPMRRDRRPATRLFPAFGPATVLALLALGLAFGSGTVASAQSYPSKPIHIVVPFAAGGITDVIARALGQRLAEAWGQQVVIDNRTGGTGQVGTESVARSAPDGYTLLVTADATFVTAPHTYSKLPYDPIADFVPVTGLGISPQAALASKASGQRGNSKSARA